MKTKFLFQLVPLLVFTTSVKGQIFTPEVNVTSNTGSFTGIGIQNPARTLDVFGSFRVENSGWVMSSFLGTHSTASSIHIRNLNSTVNPHGWELVNYASDGSLRITETNVSDRIYIKPGGNVGIGTTSPKRHLGVAGVAEFYASSTAPDPGGNPGPATRIGYYSSGDYGYIIANNSGIWPKNLILQPSGGSVGIGTTSPNSLLHIQYNANGWPQNIKGHATNSGELVGLKLSTGFGSEFNKWSGIAAVAENLYSNNTGLALYAKQQERVRITANGDVGIGTTVPSYKLDVNGTLRATSVTESSDLRLKENIAPLTTYDLRLTTGYQYNLKSDGSFHYGVIAQEVEEIFPHMVSTDEQGMKSVAYNEFIPLLIEKVREQDEKLKEQAEKLKRLHDLEKRVKDLEKILIQSKRKENE